MSSSPRVAGVHDGFRGSGGWQPRRKEALDQPGQWIREGQVEAGRLARWWWWWEWREMVMASDLEKAAGEDRKPRGQWVGLSCIWGAWE